MREDMVIGEKNSQNRCTEHLFWEYDTTELDLADEQQIRYNIY